MVMKVKKVILKTYYCLNGEYILFDSNPLHNQSYDNVEVKFKEVTQTICDVDYIWDVIEIEGQEPIDCELIGMMELDDKLVIKICQDWG